MRVDQARYAVEQVLANREQGGRHIDTDEFDKLVVQINAQLVARIDVVVSNAGYGFTLGDAQPTLRRR
jgi:NAD(P)-dependent dehydrogenase (short-subunit alcohol dehydrogenase family)